ncbi:hypothetical protein P4H42_10650 [Paenibacillus macerans]|uniref:hypothetical protein n=1 Tax=Paenibacillus macerans TaxID=44252 RepID=UPI002DBF8ACE|nr:hypothetical protein [Paenibacillus macerans]MEC0330080.1 hypothetical protein [Paenibacillus macerans]
MFRTYTERGKAWEIANSWWILLTLVPFAMTSFIAFLYIGLRVKLWRWKIWGIVYLAGTIVAFSTTAIGIGAAIALSVWVASIIHAFNVRPVFLIQLDVYKANEKVRSQQKITQMRQEAEAKFQAAGSTTQFKPPAPKKKTEADQPERAGNEEHKAEHREKTDTPATDAPAADTPATNLNQTGSGRRIDY